MAFRSTAGSNATRQRISIQGPSLVPRIRKFRHCYAYQQSQASNALQQSSQQQVQAQQQESQLQHQERHHIDPNDWDMNYWHYQPWWLQPHTVIVTGAAFFVASLIFDIEEPTLKTAILAAGPVAVYWFIFLGLLPRTFKNFAVDYIETHPEVEEQAHQQEQQQQQQHEQH